MEGRLKTETERSVAILAQAKSEMARAPEARRLPQCAAAAAAAAAAARAAGAAARAIGNLAASASLVAAAGACEAAGALLQPTEQVLEVDTRMAAIRPVITELVAAGHASAEPQVPRDVRVRRNLAEHFCHGDGGACLAGSPAVLRRRQRGGRMGPRLATSSCSTGVDDHLKRDANGNSGADDSSMADLPDMLAALTPDRLLSARPNDASTGVAASIDFVQTGHPTFLPGGGLRHCRTCLRRPLPQMSWCACPIAVRSACKPHARREPREAPRQHLLPLRAVTRWAPSPIAHAPVGAATRGMSTRRHTWQHLPIQGAVTSRSWRLSPPVALLLNPWVMMLRISLMCLAIRRVILAHAWLMMLRISLMSLAIRRVPLPRTWMMMLRLSLMLVDLPPTPLAGALLP